MDAITPASFLPPPPPPAGITPEDEYIQQVNMQRISDIRAAIGRYLGTGHRLQAVWLLELIRREDLKEKTTADKAAAVAAEVRAGP